MDPEGQVNGHVNSTVLLTAGSLLNGEIWMYYYYGFHNKYITDSSHILMMILFSHSVVSNSLWPHGLKHTRLPCPSLSPKVCSNSCRLSRWCYPTISCFVDPFSCCPQSFLASGSFPMIWLFTSGDGNIEVYLRPNSRLLIHSLYLLSLYLAIILEIHKCFNLNVKV